MSILLFSISTIAPTFLIILTGAVFRKAGFLDGETTGRMSNLVFRLLLPALILRALSGMDRNIQFTPSVIVGVLIFYFGTILLAALVSLMIRTPREKRGYFITGATFGNNAIIGYAFGEALYQGEGLVRAALLSAVIMPISIMTSGILLTPPGNRKSPLRASLDFLKTLIKNPVMVALVLGIVLWQTPLILPAVLDKTLATLGQAALPVALLAVGGSLEFKRKAEDGPYILLSTLLKLFVMPALALGAALFLKMSPAMTGSLLLMAACPSSISYYVMARNMGHDPARGAAVVTATTAVSALSAAMIAGFLKMQGWV